MTAVLAAFAVGMMLLFPAWEVVLALVVTLLVDRVRQRRR